MKSFKLANYRPIVLSAICLAVGIFVGALTANFAIPFFVMLIVFSIAFIASLFFKFKFLKVVTLFLLVGFVIMSISCFTTYTGNVDYDNVYFEGRVKEVSTATNVINRYVLEDISLMGDEISGKVLLEVEGDYEIGDRLGVFGNFEDIRFNPFDSYSISKRRENILFKSYGDDCRIVEKTKVSFIEKIRIKLKNIYVNELGEKEGAVALGLVLGDTSMVDYDTAEDMRASGLSHLFSVSGLHVGFMSSLIFLVFLIFRVDKKKSLFWVIIILLFYGALTGFPVGVVRASIMSIISLVAELMIKRYDRLNGLALAVIILLLIKPIDLFSASFLLSVGAMFGICCFYNSLTNIYKGDNFWVKRLVGGVAVSLSANAFVLPISAYYFGSISILFVLANLVVVPIASFVYMLLVPLSIFALIFEPLGILISPLRIPILLSNMISSGIASIPFATLKLTIPLFAGLLYSFALIVISKYYMGSKCSKIIISTISFIACALIIFLI